MVWGCRLKGVFPVGADSTCFKGRLSKQTERRLPGKRPTEAGKPVRIPAWRASMQCRLKEV